MPKRPDEGAAPPARPRPQRKDPKRVNASVEAAVAAAHAEPPHQIADRDVTAIDIELEHVTALADLTTAQARALVRINRAFRESHLANCSAKEALQRVYEEEAQERNSVRELSRAAAKDNTSQLGSFSDKKVSGGVRSGSGGS